MATINDKQFHELQNELNACTGASVAFNVYRDDHDYLVLSIKPNSEGSEPFGISFFHCTFISGPTHWMNVTFSVVQEELEGGEMGFVVQDFETGFSVKCFGPITFAGDPRRMYPRS